MFVGHFSTDTLIHYSTIPTFPFSTAPHLPCPTALPHSSRVTSHLPNCSLKKKSVYYSCFHLRLCVFSMNPTYWYTIVVLAVLLVGCSSSHREAVRGLHESD